MRELRPAQRVHEKIRAMPALFPGNGPGRLYPRYHQGQLVKAAIVMSMSDPIADLLTRIRNAQRADKRWVDIPASNLKKRVCVILKEEHFIRDFISVTDEVQGSLRIFLSYDHNHDPVIEGLTRISKPGCRMYTNAKDIPRVRGGLGISILTTSKGVISNKVAKRLNVGGEILCQVW